MGTQELREYYQTTWWISRSMERQESVGSRCEVCRAPSITCFHKNFDHLYGERDTDLIAVCDGCYRKLMEQGLPIKNDEGPKNDMVSFTRSLTEFVKEIRILYYNDPKKAQHIVETVCK